MELERSANLFKVNPVSISPWLFLCSNPFLSRALINLLAVPLANPDVDVRWEKVTGESAFKTCTNKSAARSTA
jgi:hypothetical protein